MRSMQQELNHRAAVWSDIQGHLRFMVTRAGEIGARHSVQQRGGLVIIELGVREGNSTCAFLAVLENVKGTLWSVDINPARTPPEWDKIEHWKFLQADDMSPEAREWLPAECDVLFIDTSHVYEHTLVELAEYAPRVRPGGVILMHDTEHGGHYPDMPQPQPDFPVAAAVKEYCWDQRLGWSNRPGSYGMGVIDIA